MFFAISIRIGIFFNKKFCDVIISFLKCRNQRQGEKPGCAAGVSKIMVQIHLSAIGKNAKWVLQKKNKCGILAIEERTKGVGESPLLNF